LRAAAALNYGVDPLGRLVRDAENFTGSAPAPSGLEGFEWIKKAGEGLDTKKLISIVKNAPSDSEAISAVEAAYPAHAAIITQLMIKSWGDFG
jgi:hypothetical protein